MESKTLKKDMALRIELGMEIEERIKARFKSEIDQLAQSNQQLDKKVAELLESQAKLSAETILESEHQRITLGLTNKMSGLESELTELKKKYDSLRDKSSKIKSEHAEFKRLDPAGLKKKLDDSKKKLKVKTQTVSDMTKDKVQLNGVMLKQKRELESFKALSEGAKSDCLYESQCQSYQVTGTAFKSETHPFAVNGMNYRVVNQSSGASYVAQWVDSSVLFDESLEFPVDVIEYIQNAISASKVETD